MDRSRLLQLLLSLLAICYLIQIAGPLRLNTDAMVFLDLATAAAQRPLPVVDSPMHPPGYPLLLALLIRAGVGSAPVFVGINLLCLAAGTWAVGRLARERVGLSKNGGLACQCVTLLSFVFVKHAFIPLSDPVFFGVSALALLALAKREEHPGNWRLLAGAVVAAGAAMSIRSIGIALLPAVLLAIAPKRRIVFGLGCLALALVALVQLARSDYYNAYMGSRGRGVSELSIFAARLHELGELLMNVPASKVSQVPAMVFIGAGLVLVLVTVLALWMRRQNWGTLEVYLAGYVAILLVWPFGDTRFWLPVLPMAAMLVALAMQRCNRSVSTLVFIAYALPGIAALAFSIRLSFSGPDFPERYGDGTLRPAYKAAWAGQPGTTDAEKAVVSLLNRFEPRVAKSTE